MTSETPNLHVLKNLNISKTAKDIEKLKTLLRLVWKCCSDAFQIGSTIFRRRGTLRGSHDRLAHGITWLKFKGDKYSYKIAEMKVGPSII